jgi:hypothetical protein
MNEMDVSSKRMKEKKYAWLQLQYSFTPFGSLELNFILTIVI